MARSKTISRALRHADVAHLVRLSRLAVLAVMVAGVLLATCAKPTKPKPTSKYLLYAGMTASADPWYGFIAIIDCETDSIIDSVVPPSHLSAPGVVVSSDGAYFATLTIHPSEIFDAGSRAQVATLATPGMPLFLPDANLLLCGRTDSTLVYSTPGFALKESWPRPRGPAVRVPGRQEVAAIESQEKTHAKLVFFDYVHYGATDSIIIDADAVPAGFQVRNYCFSPDGSRLYGVGSSQNFGSGVMGQDLRTGKTLFRQKLYAPFGYCRVTPDGKELWVTDPGGPIEEFPGWPQNIFIYDATLGTLVDTVSIRGLHPNPLSAIAPQDIRFVPDGSKAYVNCGSPTKGSQPILVIDVKTRKIQRTLFGTFRNRAIMIDIARSIQ